MRKIRKLSFEYFGERVNIEYNIIKAGKSFNRNRDDLESGGANEQKEAMIQSLTGAITKWNLEDDEENILPITSDSLDYYPGSLINALFDAIRIDIANLANAAKKRR